MSRGGGVGITNAANVGIAVQADWENREFNSNISINVRRLSSILVDWSYLRKIVSLQENVELIGHLKFECLMQNYVVTITTSIELILASSSLNLQGRITFLKLRNDFHFQTVPKFDTN
ncbi:hypothetical protein MKW92_029572 [Papaver armeniacum]|nr:hypothetical protein MKW92_029572 [Papaver armeniacum]